jgi:rubrerythrin
MSNLTTIGDLLAHAYQIEVEAVERYQMLADQMEVHNNSELEKMFRKLAYHEGQHAEEIREQMSNADVPVLKPGEFRWSGPDSPEAVDLGEIHYMMTPWHALQLALKAEQQAFAFFDEFRRSASDPDIKRLADEFAEEEEEHVAMVLKELEKYPEPDDEWDDDPDPPVSPE